MMADCADEHELATGNRQEGMFFAASSIAIKAAFGIGSFVGPVASVHGRQCMKMKKEAFDKLVLEGKKSQAVRRKLLQRTPGSAKIKSRGKSLSQEIVRTVDLPHSIYIDSCDGGTMTDVDGNTYLDMTMGFGPCVLGHRPPVVTAALKAQLAKGWHFGIPNARQAELADLIEEASPCADKVVFFNSGTEATLSAMRMARAFTGKTRIALFDGCYHGSHDYALIFANPESDRDRPAPMRVGAGIPKVIEEQAMLVLPYRNDVAFDLIREHKDDLAAVFLEPSQNSHPRLDNAEFLAGLKSVCGETGVLLGFDEVVTGFRIAYGGCQEYYRITPDFATYGKAIGAGLPIGAVAGRKDIMNCFSGKGGAPWMFSGGTFNGNPLSMTAGVAAVTEMRDNKNRLYPYLMEQGNRLAAEVNDFCMKQQFQAQLLNAGSKVYLRFQNTPINSSRDISEDGKRVEREFYLHLLGHNVIIPGVHLAFLSAAHTPEDVDTIIGAFKQSFLDLREDGLF